MTVRRYDGVAAVPAGLGPTVVTVGMFDGVHRGHRALLDRVAADAAAGGVPGAAVTFDRHPLAVLRPGTSDDDGLRAEIGGRIAAELGKPLRPEIVEVVTALPKTRSGKVMRRVVRAAYLGLDPGDLSSLDDPSSLHAIEELARRRGNGGGR